MFVTLVQSRGVVLLFAEDRAEEEIEVDMDQSCTKNDLNYTVSVCQI